jgi:hypothetical protein
VRKSEAELVPRGATLTHDIQLNLMDFEQACGIVESFCAKASLDFESSLDHARKVRAEVRDQDRGDWGGHLGDDDMIEGGEEMRVAQDEEWPLIEGYQSRLCGQTIRQEGPSPEVSVT